MTEGRMRGVHSEKNEWQYYWKMEFSMRRNILTVLKLYIGILLTVFLLTSGNPYDMGIPKTVTATGIDEVGDVDVENSNTIDSYTTEAGVSDGDFDYDGPIDMFTGSPISSDGGQDTTQRVNISDGSVYDRATGYYIYSVDNGSVSVSVADGMIVAGDVTVALSENANVRLYKDGEPLDDFPGLINAPGSYAIISGDTGNDGQIMGFRVVSNITGSVNQYNLPAGFSVRSVTINGNDVAYDYGVVDMTQEGVYNINYICSDNGITYTLNVTIDHTPPQVTFEGLDENNRAKGPVTITGLQEGDTVSVISGNEVKKLNLKSQITESGDYRVVVSDAAGNYIERQFKILVYLNLQAWMLFGFILILIVGMAIALTLTRKNLRVR